MAEVFPPAYPQVCLYFCYLYLYPSISFVNQDGFLKTHASTNPMIKDHQKFGLVKFGWHMPFDPEKIYMT